jgi:hypothetical protein
MLYDQREFTRVDEYGIDPLLDDSYDAIYAVTSYATYTVNAQEKFNPALISWNVYNGTIRWWRHIMVYNGIDDVWDITEGRRIKIPNINEMTTLLQRAKGSTTTVVTI